jgi:hypothetical protein
MGNLRRNFYLNYFPHKDHCPQDSKPCLGNKCKYWIGEKRCWDREFDALVMEMFNVEYGGDYIYFKDENGRHIEGIRHVHFQMSLSDKEDKEKLIPVTATIGFNSRRLTEKVQEKFQLTDWEFESQCQDGGDDHALEKIINGNYENKEGILDLLNFVQNLIPDILQFERGINTCAACGNKCDALTEYSGKAICEWCERKIIQENIDKYIKT